MRWRPSSTVNLTWSKPAPAPCTRPVYARGVNNPDTAFITHLHSDHTVGLPDLIHKPWTTESNSYAAAGDLLVRESLTANTCSCRHSRTHASQAPASRYALNVISLISSAIF
jgi:phosphoribosyl 1,2-cyclic phosphodiesterase